MKRLPLLLGILLLLAACEKDIEFNGEVTNPLMVINAIIPQDSLFEVKVTKSRFFTQYEDTFETVKNATVELYINGVFAETMTHTGNGHYTSGYRVTDGDLIRIVSEAPNLKTTTAEMRVASAANVVSLDTSIVIQAHSPIVDLNYYEGNNAYTYDTIGWNYTCTIHFKLIFSDPPDMDNFYRLVVYTNEYYDPIHYLNRSVWYEKSDMVFGENKQNSGGIINDGDYNAYGTFTDELFEGKNYPLTFSIDVNYSYFLDENVVGYPHRSEPSDIFIDLQTLSRSYYLYLVTSSKYTPDDLFAEPVKIHSNVIGGTGIVGNYNNHLIPIKLPH